MIIRRTFDLSEIDAVIKHPDIWPRIADKDQSQDSFRSPLAENIFYVIGVVDNQIIGLMIYRLNENILETHVQVIPEFRAKYASEFASDALLWAEENISFEKFTATINDEFKTVIDFALLHGFEIVKKELSINYLERKHELG